MKKTEVCREECVGADIVSDSEFAGGGNFTACEFSDFPNFLLSHTHFILPPDVYCG